MKELIEFDEKDFQALTQRNLKNLKIQYFEYDQDEAIEAWLNDHPDLDQMDDLLDRVASPALDFQGQYSLAEEMKMAEMSEKHSDYFSDSENGIIDNSEKPDLEATFTRWNYESGTEKASQHYFKTNDEENWEKIQVESKPKINEKPEKSKKIMKKKNESLIYFLAKSIVKIWFLTLLTYFYLCQWIYKRFFGSYVKALGDRFQQVKNVCTKISGFISWVLKIDSQSIFYELMLD